MSVVPRRQYGVALTLALAVVGAVVGSVVLFSSSRAEDVDLTTASLVPADSGLYVAFNTDLDTSQWVTAFNLVERLGQEDPEGELRRSAGDEGIDWEEDVAPFLGGNAAFFLRSFDLETFQFSGGAIIRANDPEKALSVLEEQGGLLLETREEDGVEYFVDEFSGAYAAILAGHLVLAMDERSLLDIIAVHLGSEPSLASVDDFQALRDELSRNFLAFVYMDSESILANSKTDPVFESAMREAGVDIALEPTAGVIGADGDGFNFQGASISQPGTVAPLLEPRVSGFAGVVPADTSVFVSMNGLGTVLRETLDAARDDIDSAIQGSGYASVDDLFAEAGAAFGLTSVEELLDLFAGETAVALWFPTGDADQPEGLLLTEVADPGAARDIIEGVVPAETPLDTREVGGVEVTVATDETGEEFAYALDGSTLLIGTVAGVTRTLENSGPVLADNETYIGAVGDLPTGLGSFGYFDFSVLMRLAEGGVPPQLDRADEALKGMIVNMVQERGVVRVSGVVTVEEE